MLRGRVIGATALAQYIFLMAFSLVEGNYAKAVYWLGASIITTGVLML